MKRTSLRTKLLTGGILIVLIPLLVVGIFSAYKSSTALQDISLEQSVNVARAPGSIPPIHVTASVTIDAIFGEPAVKVTVSI